MLIVSLTSPSPDERRDRRMPTERRGSRLGFEPPIVALHLADSEPASLPETVALADADFDWLHVDVADGSFVPRLTWGAPLLELLRRWTHATLDAHLLVARPARILGALCAAKAGVVTVHPSTCDNAREVLKSIRRGGARAGVAIDPGTSFESVRRLLDEADVVNVLTAPIEFEHGAFQSELLARVRAAREHRERAKLHYLIQVDGGLKLDTIAAAREAGADVYVVGAPVFEASDQGCALATFRAAVRGQTLNDSPDGVTTQAPVPPVTPRVFMRRRAA